MSKKEIEEEAVEEKPVKRVCRERAPLDEFLDLDPEPPRMRYHLDKPASKKKAVS